MEHRQLLRRAVLAVGLASAVGAFAQGPPVPPGADEPGYGGDEIETVIVIGEKLRCPDGTIVNTINECPGFIQSWLNRIYRLPWDPITHVIGGDTIPNAPTCGATTVDASCVCGGGKVKVYDDSNDTFHCKPEPPAAGCPKWDQTFDFDPNAWECVTRPFGNAKADAERIKNCVGGVVSSQWSRFANALTYGSAGGHWGGVGCNRTSANPYVSIRTLILNDQLYTRRSGSHASPWQYMAHTLIHESLHVRDYYKYQRCDPWNDDTMKIILTSNGHDASRDGWERYTHEKTLDMYKAQLGVLSPRDPNYRASQHRNLPCSLQ